MTCYNDHMIKYILLGLLSYLPMTGYDLKQMIDHSISHFWHAHHSQIYSTLREMEADGLVTSELIEAEGERDRRVYSLTEKGLQEFRTWLDQSMTEMSLIKDDLLVRVFFSAQREKPKVLAELVLQREMHQQKLKLYHTITSEEIARNATEYPQMARDAKFWQATLNLGVRYEEAYIDWLNETIQMVENS